MHKTDELFINYTTVESGCQAPTLIGKRAAS